MSGILERAKALCDEINTDLRIGVILPDREEEAAKLLLALITECKNLAANNAYLQEKIDEAHGIMCETNLLLAKEANECDKWRKMAIEERARMIHIGYGDIEIVPTDGDKEIAEQDYEELMK